MRRVPVVLSIALVLCTTAVVSAQGRLDASPFDPPPPQRTGWHLINGVWVKPAATCEWSDLIRIGWHDGNLTVEPLPDAKVRTMLSGGRRAAVEVGAGQGLYEIGQRVATVRRGPRPAGGDGGADDMGPASGGGGGTLIAQLLNRADGATPSPLRLHTMIARTDSIRLTARGALRGVQVMVSLSSDVRRGVQLSVALPEQPRSPENMALRADSLDELIEQHPLAARRYLSPVLRLLSDGAESAGDPLGPGPADVYLAFPEVSPTEDAKSRVADVLPRMIDEDPEVRTDAMDELRSLGAGGICAALRLPFDQLHPQQQVMIEQLVAETSRRQLRLDRSAQASAFRSDPVFLADCLEFPDARVRELAVVELRRAVDPKLELDAFDAKACAARADALRERLLGR